MDHPNRWFPARARADVGNGSVWSLGRDRIGLQPNATEWLPKFCDPQLFQVIAAGGKAIFAPPCIFP
jgi:hypothetical protein